MVYLTRLRIQNTLIEQSLLNCSLKAVNIFLEASPLILHEYHLHLHAISLSLHCLCFIAMLAPSLLYYSWLHCSMVWAALALIHGWSSLKSLIGQESFLCTLQCVVWYATELTDTCLLELVN